MFLPWITVTIHEHIGFIFIFRHYFYFKEFISAIFASLPNKLTPIAHTSVFVCSF
jgi:hypothetical protein